MVLIVETMAAERVMGAFDLQCRLNHAHKKLLK